MDAKLLSRNAFREAVFARDKHRCVVCGAVAVDAHHLIERRLFPDGGYYLDNGASLCEEHHLDAEDTTLSVEGIRNAAGITRVVVPDQFYPEQPITKWGDYVLDDGRRTRGPLFHDENVQRILTRGGVLGRYTPYVKYGRTMHLPWSPGAHEDDRTLQDCRGLEGREVVVTVKMDGENTSMYRDRVHARSIDSRGGADRAWVKGLWSTIAHEIPEGWRVCGENMWAKHSIPYDDLASYFLVFSVWNDRNVCQSWDDTLTYLAVLGLTPVPVVYRGPWDERTIRELTAEIDVETREGLVVRVAEAFPYAEFHQRVAKWVRPGHVRTTSHWRAGQRLVPNRLATHSPTPRSASRPAGLPASVSSSERSASS